MRKLILAAVMVLACSVPVFAHTQQELIDSIRRMTRDTDTTNQRRTDAAIASLLDNAEQQFCKDSRCIHKTTYTTTVTNTVEYSLPTDWITSVRVMYAIKPLTSTTTNYKQIDYFTKEGMDQKKGTSWEDATADYPSSYYYPSTDKIALYPKPSSTYAGANYLKMDYIALPSSMTATTDTPFDGYNSLTPYHMSLVWYTLALIAIEDGDNAKAGDYMTKYDRDVAYARNEMNDKPDKTGGFQPR